MLEPSLAAAAGKTVHRFTTSRPHSAHSGRVQSIFSPAARRQDAEWARVLIAATVG
jgi:hypothetical protein